MTEQTKQLKAAMQLAEMHQAANPTDHNQATVERTTAEYEQALAEETELAETGTVKIAGQGGVIIDGEKEQRIQALEAELAEAKALLNEQRIEKAQKIEEAQKSALSGETAPAPAATIPAAPAATEPATTPAAPAAEGDVKKN